MHRYRLFNFRAKCWSMVQDRCDVGEFGKPYRKDSEWRIRAVARSQPEAEAAIRQSAYAEQSRDFTLTLEDTEDAPVLALVLTP